MENSLDIALPPALISALKNQQVVLFLGAGASRGAVHPKEKKVPNGNDLRDLISDKFLGGQLKDRPLTQVAELAINETDLTEVQKFFRDIFIEFSPADFHKLIPTFQWHAIVTTNFDLLLESAYKANESRLQNLVKFVKNGQKFENELKKTTNGVSFLKIHGCIDFYMDAEIPLILSSEQYARYSKNRSRLFDRIGDWGHEFTILFCGYSISDPHIQSILFDLFDLGIRRPTFYCVSPNIRLHL